MQKGLPYFGRKFFRFVRNDKTEFYIFGAVCRAPDGSLYALGRALSRSLPNGRYFLPSALFEPKKIVTLINL